MDETIKYFKKSKVYYKIFVEFRKKYKRLGHFGGNISLKDISPQEREAISGFLGREVEEKISCKEFIKALEKSRFAGYSLEEIVKEYFCEELITKKEEKQAYLQSKDKYFDNISKATNNLKIKEWISEILKNDAAVIRNYNRDKDELKYIIISVIKAIEYLIDIKTKSKSKESIAVFSSNVTGNPHFFDEDTLANSLLSNFLIWYFSFKNNPNISNSENKSKLLYLGGIIKDGICNDVLVYGIKGIKLDGEFHEGLDGFLQVKEPVKLSLITILNLKKLVSFNNVVYIVENPAVFEVLISKYPEKTFICGNGQINKAVFNLLDLFDENIRFDYSGDFDPEGLQIAQKLKDRYSDRLSLSKYKKEFYKKYLSSKYIEEYRIKKLDKITDIELLEIVDEMKDLQRAAYQESMLCEY